MSALPWYVLLGLSSIPRPTEMFAVQTLTFTSSDAPAPPQRAGENQQCGNGVGCNPGFACVYWSLTNSQCRKLDPNSSIDCSA